MRRWLIRIGALGLLALLVGGLYVRFGLLWFPPDVGPGELVCPAEAPALQPGQRLRVLVWNIQYGASRKHHFFYDGGDAVHVPAADVEATLDAIAAVVAREKPDIVLWQELDRGSDRTGRVDQLALLRERLGGPGGFPCYAAAAYHKVGYVPHPPHAPMGAVDMQLGVFSRYRLAAATRIQLALLDEPAWRRWFNLRRALLEVHAPVEGAAEPLVLLDTHLSAFSGGDGTLARQIETLAEHAERAERARAPWLLAGDLNSLPPGDDPRRLGADAAWYSDAQTPVGQLFERFASSPPLGALQATPARWRTYLPFGATAPDRTLDYVFYGGGLEVRRHQVLAETAISDHLPLRLDVGLPATATPGEAAAGPQP